MGKRPNVLFILTDDQRYDTIRALGNPHINTPNLDALCAEGMAFTNAHIPGGTVPAVCMPSRAMIHTGRSLYGLQEDGKDIPADHAMMCETFRKNGYRTFGTGKWHNGPGSYHRCFDAGDDIFFGGMWDHWNVPVYEFKPDGDYDQVQKACIGQFYSNKTIPTRATHIHMGEHSTDLFTNRAMEWLEAYNQDDPFYLYLAYLAPHDPRTMPEPFNTMYDPDKMPLDCYAGEHFHFGIEDIRDEKLESFPRPPNAVKQHIADYYGMISHIDDRVGKLIDLLKRKGLYDNTIIVFTGDNGLAVGRHGLMGKQNCYEHGLRVPLLMAGPGIPQGARNGDYRFLYDLFPTLCSLCGVDIPASVEGMDFSGLFRGEAAAKRDEVYASFSDKIRTYKDTRYKIIEYRYQKLAVTQLYDLEADPLETRNLAEDPEYAAVRERLTKKLVEHGNEPREREHRTGRIFWARYFKDSDFVEPEVVDWMSSQYKP